MRNVCIVLALVLGSVFSQNANHIKFKRYYEEVTWDSAQATCREKHGDLLTVRNENDNKALDETRGWIGLYRENDNSPWKWSNGDELAHTFIWDVDHPLPGKHCAYKTYSTRKWWSFGCHETWPFLCSDEPLVLVKENKTWEEALEHCRSLWGTHRYDLLTMISPDDHEYARERAQEATTDEVWTGLRYLGGEWMWVGGEPMQYSDIPSCPAEGCGVVDKTSNASFEIRDCSQRRNFFCSLKHANA